MSRLAAIATLAILATGSLLAACAPTSSYRETRPTLACQSPVVLGHPTMPNPTRLTTTLSFDFNQLRLSPPPRGADPVVSATRAWKAVRTLQRGPTYKLVLAQSNSEQALGGPSPRAVVVWVVRGSDVRVDSLGRARSCRFESALWPVDATTGVAYGELVF